MPRARFAASTIGAASTAGCRKTFAALVLTIALFSSISSAVAESPAVRQIYIHARRFSFSPAQITLKKGQTVKLILISDDVPHGLSVPGLGIQAEIIKRHRTEVLVTPTHTGDFPGSCSVYCGSGHRDMEFLVHVVD